MENFVSKSIQVLVPVQRTRRSLSATSLSALTHSHIGLLREVEAWFLEYYNVVTSQEITIIETNVDVVSQQDSGTGNTISYNQELVYDAPSNAPSPEEIATDPYDDTTSVEVLVESLNETVAAFENVTGLVVVTLFAPDKGSSSNDSDSVGTIVGAAVASGGVTFLIISVIMIIRRRREDDASNKNEGRLVESLSDHHNSDSPQSELGGSQLLSKTTLPAGNRRQHMPDTARERNFSWKHLYQAPEDQNSF